jgi:hypothetical protein
MGSVSALKDRTVAYSMFLRPRRMRKTYKKIYVEGRRDISAIQCPSVFASYTFTKYCLSPLFSSWVVTCSMAYLLETWLGSASNSRLESTEVVVIKR